MNCPSCGQEPEVCARICGLTDPTPPMKGEGWVVFSYVPNVGDCVRDLDDPYADQEQIACAHAALTGAAERTGNAAIMAAAHKVTTSRNVADYLTALAVLRASIA